NDVVEATLDEGEPRGDLPRPGEYLTMPGLLCEPARCPARDLGVEPVAGVEQRAGQENGEPARAYQKFAMLGERGPAIEQSQNVAQVFLTALAEQLGRDDRVVTAQPVDHDVE